MRSEVGQEIQSLRTETRHEFEKIDDKLARFRLQLTIKLGVMLGLSVGLISTIIALKF